MSYAQAMEAAGATVHDYARFGSYQGDWLADVTFDGGRGIIAGSYGSCSGCDAFEATFGYNDSDDGCSEHSYEKRDDCVACTAQGDAYFEKLRDFGIAYLDRVMNEDELARYRAEMVEQSGWDSDAPAIIDWLDAHTS